MADLTTQIKEMEDLCNNIKKNYTEEDLPAISLSAYKNNFLKVHLGNTDENDEHDLQEWISFVGGPYNKAIVYDDRTGEPIATVPPIYPEKPLNLVAEKISYKEAEERKENINTQYGMLRASEVGKLPIQIKNNQDEFFGALQQMVNSDAMDNLKKEWIDFYIKIGVIVEKKPVDTPSDPGNGMNNFNFITNDQNEY